MIVQGEFDLKNGLIVNLKPLGNALIFKLMSADFTLGELVKPCFGDLQHAAHQRDGKLVLMGLNERKPQGFACAKKVSAFFRLSRSC